MENHRFGKLLLLIGVLALSSCAGPAGSSSAPSSTRQETTSASETDTEPDPGPGDVTSSDTEVDPPVTSDPWDKDARGVPASIGEDPELMEYYEDVDWSLGGEDLLVSLDDCLDSHAKYIPSYSQAREILAESDAYPGKPGYVYGFYTGKPTSSWNREHVWPSSRLGHTNSGPGADPQMLRACDSSVNGDRANYYYAESGNNTYDPAKHGVEAYRGNCARIVFYEAVRWQENGLHIDDTPKAMSDTSDSDKSMGKLSDLLRWNKEYPLMADEEPRNEVIYEEVGVRNPFIDAPEIAMRIWG